jgi:hypothetical protein
MMVIAMADDSIPGPCTLLPGTYRLGLYFSDLRFSLPQRQQITADRRVIPRGAVGGTANDARSRYAEYVRRPAFRLGLVRALDAVSPLGLGSIKGYVGILEQRVQRVLGIHAH